MLIPYYPDLSQYKNHEQLTSGLVKSISNIGWISSTHGFPTGEVNPLLLNKLKTLLLQRGGVNVIFSRGINRCPLCKKSIAIPREGLSDLQLGISEVWIPYNEKVFASPDMIFHFISEHSYKPPEIFETALLSFDIKSDWESQEFFDTLLKRGQK